jgi:hypothetical protein
MLFLPSMNRQESHQKMVAGIVLFPAKRLKANRSAAPLLS